MMVPKIYTYAIASRVDTCKVAVQLGGGEAEGRVFQLGRVKGRR